MLRVTVVVVSDRALPLLLLLLLMMLMLLFELW